MVTRGRSDWDALLMLVLAVYHTIYIIDYANYFIKILTNIKLIFVRILVAYQNVLMRKDKYDRQF